MYASCKPYRVVASTVVSGTFDAGTAKLPLRLDELQKLDVVACISEENDALLLFIVNRSLDRISLSCDLSQWQPAGEVVVRELAGPDCEAYNTVFEPCALQEKVRFASLNGSCWEGELEPHSVSVLEVRLSAYVSTGILNRIG